MDRDAGNETPERADARARCRARQRFRQHRADYPVDEQLARAVRVAARDIGYVRNMLARI